MKFRSCSKYYKFFPALILVFYLASRISSAAPIQGDPKIFDLNFEVSITNTTDEVTDIRLVIPDIKDDLPHQKIIGISYNPFPASFVRTPDGDKIEFVFEKMEPGEERRCRIRARTRNLRIIHPVRALEVEPAIPSNIKKYLESSERYPVEAPEVKKTVEKITAGEELRYYRAQKIYDYVRSLDYRMQNAPADVISVLQTGKCQCSDASDLFITLCRAAGIPARYVGGIYMKEADQSTPDTHAWVEIYLSPYGWLPVDPTMSRFDRITRLSRFCEIDDPYLKMWLNSNSAFHIELLEEEAQLEEGSVKKRITWKAYQPKSGIPVQKLYPGFSYEFPEDKRVEVSTEVPAAREAFSNGMAALESNDGEKALAEFNRAIEEDPSFISPWIYVLSMKRQQGKKNEIETELKKRIQNVQKGGIREQALRTVLGMLYYYEKDYSDADISLDVDPQDPEVKFYADYFRALLYTNTLQKTSAAGYLNKAIIMNPEEVQLYAEIFDLFNYLEDYESIVKICQSAVEVIPAPEFYDETARAYIEMNRLGEAENAAEKALAMAPGRPMFWGTMGRIHLRMGKTGQGMMEVKKALEMGVSPEDEAALAEDMAKYGD